MAMPTDDDLDLPEVRRGIEVVLSRIVDDPEKRARRLDAEELIDAA
jgi:hypothetical protein